jgi:hypothetical protein
MFDPNETWPFEVDRRWMNTSQLVKTFTTNHHSYRHPNNFIRVVMTLLNVKLHKHDRQNLRSFLSLHKRLSRSYHNYQVKHQWPLYNIERNLNVKTDNRQHRTPRTDCITERVPLSDCHGSTAGSGPHTETPFLVCLRAAFTLVSIMFKHPSQRGKKTSHWRTEYKEYTLHSDVTTVLYSLFLRRHGQGLITKKFT